MMHGVNWLLGAEVVVAVGLAAGPIARWTRNYVHKLAFPEGSVRTGAAEDLPRPRPRRRTPAGRAPTMLMLTLSPSGGRRCVAGGSSTRFPKASSPSRRAAEWRGGGARREAKSSRPLPYRLLPCWASPQAPTPWPISCPIGSSVPQRSGSPAAASLLRRSRPRWRTMRCDPCYAHWLPEQSAFSPLYSERALALAMSSCARSSGSGSGGTARCRRHSLSGAGSCSAGSWLLPSSPCAGLVERIPWRTAPTSSRGRSSCGRWQCRDRP